MSAKVTGGIFVAGFLVFGGLQSAFNILDVDKPAAAYGGKPVALVNGEVRAKGNVKVPTVHGSTYTGGTYNRSGRASEGQIDGWITEALKVMKRDGVPGTRRGIKKIMTNESGGDPTICNGNDINARNGVPSCGLMQVIPTTFQANHCEGTSWQLTDPVANICAASTYAARRYGSIDRAPTPY